MGCDGMTRREFIRRVGIAGLVAYEVAHSGRLAAGKAAVDDRRELTERSEMMKGRVPVPAPLIPNGAWANVLETHPRLLGGRSYVRAMARAKPELYRLIREDESIAAVGDVRKTMAADPARHSYEVFWTAAYAAGIRHAVEGLSGDVIEAFIAAAKGIMQGGVTNVHQDTWVSMNGVALVYDVFFDHIPPSDREAMIAWLNPHLEVYVDDEYAVHNSCLSKILCYVKCAYATWGENPDAQRLRDHALVTLYERKVLPVLQEFGAGGGWTEAGWYQRHSIWHLVEALELARRIEGYDGFQRAPEFFYQRMAYDLSQSYPSPRPDGTERFATEGDGSDAYWWGDESTRHARSVLAQYFRGSELARFVANQRPAGPLPPARIPNFLYEEEPDAPLGMSGFPTAHLAAGVGKVYARSDWTHEATWLRFQAGGYFSQHQHFDVGGFEIFRHESLATESGRGAWGGPHGINWWIRTIAHNCILVYRPGETWERMRGGGPGVNDGGQAKKWDGVVGSLEAWQARQSDFERGRITAYHNQPEFLHVAADCTSAYAPTKLAKWVREIAFIRPGTFVILDRVVSTKPEYEKTWLLHMRNEPRLHGTMATTINGEGRLTVQTLLPEKAAVRTVYGYAYRGQTFDVSPTRRSDPENRWRIEVSPAEARREDLFLHVLTAEDAGDATAERASVVRDGMLVGARVGRAEVLFGRDGGRLRIGSKEYELTNQVKRDRFE